MEHTKSEEALAVPNKSALFQVFKRFSQNYFIFYILLASIVILSFASNAFFTTENLMNVLRQCSIISIIAVGSFLVIVTTGIDISVGSTVAFVGIITAKLIAEANFNVFAGVLIGLAAGVIIGLINAYLVTSWGIPAFVVTLGTMGTLRGLTYVMTNAYPVSDLPDSIRVIGRGYIGPIPIPVIIMILIYVIGYFLTEHTRTGRYIFALGGNREAAHLSGINVKLYESLAYVIGSLMGAISGIILLSRLNSGQPNAGIGFEFEAITAAVLGGTSLLGGKGRIFGVFFGGLFIAILNNGMTLLNVSSYYQQMLKGIILILAVLLDVSRNRKKK